MSGISRRSLLGVGAAALVTPASALAASAQRRSAGRVKNIIFCVADGMAMSVPTMADHFQQLVHGKPSYLSWLMTQDFVVQGLQDTRSLSSVVTDSSAASSTWGSGRRIWNGQVNMFPDGTELRPLTQILGDGGVRCGLVTTTTISHATPAGFSVSVPNRGQEPLIAVKYLNANVDVLLGGGDRFFNPEKRSDKRDLYADFVKAGYTLVKDRSSLIGRRAPKLLGIFSDSHIPFSVDRNNSFDLRRQVPTLAEMAETAIENLKDSRNGFVLQIEGGKVDHAAHSNDLAAMLYDQIAFEEAVKVAIDFARKDGNTLVVITSDHCTGGPALNGAGTEYFDSTAGLKSVANMKASYSEFFPRFTRDKTLANVQGAFDEFLNVKLTTDQAQTILDAANGKFALSANGFMRSLNSTVAAVLSNHTKVGWTSLNHTSDYVFVAAVGPGRERFRGLTQNYKMFDIMLDLKGMKWSNPTMTFEEAKGHMDKRGGGLAYRDELHV